MSSQLFNTNDQKFSFEAYGVTIMCQKLDVEEQVAFYVTFSSHRKPITVARAKFVTSPMTWTSIPEGRQKEAEGIGQLIDQYLTSKG